MNMKKFLLLVLAVLSVVTILSISVMAADPIMSTEPGAGFENEIKFELGKHLTISTSETNDKHDRLPYLFDGDIADGGIYSRDDHTWFGPEGDHLLITFSEPTLITKFAWYLTGNWSKSKIEFFNESGEVILTVDDDDRSVATGNAYGPQAEKKVVFLADSPSDTMLVSSIKMTTYDNKWDAAYTFKVSEIELWGFHEHKFEELKSVTKIPSCADFGSAEYACSCGDTTEKLVDPTGNHRILYNEKVFFRDGFTSDGYLVSEYCATCGTMDVQTEVEIGALFTSLGYSVRESGSFAIQYGVAVHYDNIALYNEITGSTLQFGVAAASRAAFAEGNPLIFDGEAIAAVDKTVIYKNYTTSEYDIFSYSIQGFNDKNAEFILSAFVFDGNDIYYLGEETTKDAQSVSYSSFAKSEE